MGVPVLALLLALVAVPGTAGAGGASAEAQQAALRAFLAVVQDWQAEAWGAIYDGATARSRKVVSRRAFGSIMERTGARLRRDDRAVRVVGLASRYETLVEITVVLGYRAPSSAFRREAFQMELENGRWRVSTVAVLFAGPEEVAPPPQVEH